uniref:Tripartite motif-containing protein 16-like n=1 Tax=Neogobius melanostomus TaxID=47308 RepID=A0A8C6U289_9GOBI
MAQRAREVTREVALNCPICLDTMKDPATLPCGHSYCMNCIQTDWHQKVQYRCPQCRKIFTHKPVLAKNTVLASLVEELKTTGHPAPHADHCYASPGDVSCDVCTGRKLKAIRSCLQCLVSYCETHLQPHRNVAVLKRHQLVAPSDKLEENLCSKHNELKKLFCRTDQQIICSLCVDQHQGHHTVSCAAERAHRQKQLKAKRARLQRNLQHKETEQERLRQEARDIGRSAQTAVQRSGDSFREMVLLLDKRRSEVEQQIISEEQIQLKPIQELQDQLQRDVTELKRSISELDTLSLTPDHNQFLLMCPSLSTDSEKTESRLQSRPRKDFEDVSRAVSELRDQLQLSLREFNMFEPEPRSREDFLRYASEITLDPNTAHKRLSLSDGNRRATFTSNEQNIPDHPDRFVNDRQVLSTEGLKSRCYWEVQWSSTYPLYIAASYRDIKRQGTSNECAFGYNDQSWALRCSKNSYSFYFNRVESEVSGPISGRIGVYLDHRAGALSFYSVEDKTMSLLHRVQTTFTQPLFAGVHFDGDMFGYIGDTAHFLKLK